MVEKSKRDPAAALCDVTAQPPQITARWLPTYSSRRTSGTLRHLLIPMPRTLSERGFAKSTSQRVIISHVP